MRQIIPIFALILFVNCSTAQITTAPAPNPSREDACAKYQGTKWFDCLKAEKKMWQARESAQGIETVLSEERVGDDIVRIIQTCWADFCRVKTEKTYQPSFLTELKRNGVVGALFYLAGLLTGLGV